MLESEQPSKEDGNEYTHNTKPSCAACKYFHRKCSSHCLFPPYFPADAQGQKNFHAVHSVYGFSKVVKALIKTQPHLRHDAIKSRIYEAQCRLRYPRYGCTGIIAVLHRQLQEAMLSLRYVRKELAMHVACSKPSRGGPLQEESIMHRNIGLDQATTVGGGLCDQTSTHQQPFEFQQQDWLTRPFPNLQHFLDLGETGACGELEIGPLKQCFTTEDILLRVALLEAANSALRMHDGGETTIECPEQSVITIDDDNDDGLHTHTNISEENFSSMN